jgi:hypothetical protein
MTGILRLLLLPGVRQKLHPLFLNQTTKNWHIRYVTLSETKDLAVRFFAEIILSGAEGLRMTRLSDYVVKCTNVVWFDLETATAVTVSHVTQ